LTLAVCGIGGVDPLPGKLHERTLEDLALRDPFSLIPQHFFG
jgi:hypothetical protein